MTTPSVADVILGLEARGAKVLLREGALVIRPGSAATPTEREVLTTLAFEAAAYVRSRALEAPKPVPGPWPGDIRHRVELPGGGWYWMPGPAPEPATAEASQGFAGIEATSLYKLTTTLVVDVPGLGGPLYITPSCREAEALRATAPKPSVVFCRCRVIDLLLAGATKAEARAILEAALIFDGSITGVRVQ